MTSITSSSKPIQTSTTPSCTTFELHTPASLLDSPHLPALFSLINRCFNEAHGKDGRSLLPPSELARLQTHEQLGEEVGPDGFILVMLQQSNESTDHEVNQYAKDRGFISPTGQRVIGSASAKPYTISKPNKELPGVTGLFKRLPPANSSEKNDDDDHTPQWEILAMSVDPVLQGRGLASQLMNLTIDEIKRRCGSGLRDTNIQIKDSNEPNITTAVSEGEKKKEVMLLLSTMQVLNESYYAKRGWTTTNTRWFPKGTSGSRDGFAVVEMFKRVEL